MDAHRDRDKIQVLVPVDSGRRTRGEKNRAESDDLLLSIFDHSCERSVPLTFSHPPPPASAPLSPLALRKSLPLRVSLSSFTSQSSSFTSQSVFLYESVLFLQVYESVCLPLRVSPLPLRVSLSILPSTCASDDHARVSSWARAPLRPAITPQAPLTKLGVIWIRI